MKRAILPDHDGTLIEDAGALRAVGDVAFPPWAPCGPSNQAGLPVVGHHDPSGVAPGLLTEETINDVHKH